MVTMTPHDPPALAAVRIQSDGLVQKSLSSVSSSSFDVIREEGEAALLHKIILMCSLWGHIKYATDRTLAQLVPMGDLYLLKHNIQIRNILFNLL